MTGATNRTPAPEIIIPVIALATYTNVGDERECIMSNVLRELAQRIAMRGTSNPVIDLRWITPADHDAIARLEDTDAHDSIVPLRPIVLALLGEEGAPISSTGKKPPSDTSKAHPWLMMFASRNDLRPILTAMESLIGDPLMQRRVYLYRRVSRLGVRDTRMGKGSPAGAGTQGALGRIVSRAKEQGITVRPFRDVQELDAAVLSDLLAATGCSVPEGRPEDVSRRQLERQSELCAFYVPRHKLHDRLNRHANSEDAPLVIAGPSGCGKSALIANWTKKYYDDNRDAVVITHFVGTGPSSADVDGITRRIMQEINRGLGLNEALPTTPSDRKRRFADWLSLAGSRRLVLVIDALDQLEPDAQDLTWLPAHLPPNVRLIVSVATPPPPVTAAELSGTTRARDRRGQSDASIRRADTIVDDRKADVPAVVAGRRWSHVNVPPLSLSEQRDVIDLVMDQTGARITAKHIAKHIAGKPASGHPDTLRMALVQMRAVGTHEDLERIIARYRTAATPQDAMMQTLERLEETDGPIVRQVLSILWASHRGMHDEELREVLEVDEATLGGVLMKLDRLLMRRGGLLGFYHQHIREAVEQRYELTGADARRLHRRLARYFQERPVSPRRADEEPWGWMMGRSWKSLLACITDVSMFLQFCELEREHELRGYWAALGRRAHMEHAYIAALENAVREGHVGGGALPGLCAALGSFLHQAAHYDAALALYSRAASSIRGRDPGLALKRAAVARHRGVTLQALARYPEARRAFQRALAFCQNAGEATSVEAAELYECLGALEYTAKQYHKAEHVLQTALELWEQIAPGDSAVTLGPLSTLAGVLLEAGYADRALPRLERILMLSEQRYGADHPITGAAANNVGAAIAALGRFQEALELADRAVAIDMRSYGPAHPETARKLTNMAMYLKKLNRLRDAGKKYRQALAVLEAAHGPWHPDVADGLNNLAALYRNMKQYAKALPLYERALAIRLKVFGPNNVSTVHVRLNIASLRVLMAPTRANVRRYIDAIKQKIRVSGMKDPETRRTIANLYAVWQKLGLPDDEFPFPRPKEE